ncbi:MAG TPA: hypothetical protein VFJ82_03340 [Longimicrobium sp.]|nr:hypothetical protein [Longimicrobium sp.]
MTKTITATYDRREIHPDEPLPLPRDTRLTITWQESAVVEDPLAAAYIELPRTSETFAEAVRRIRIDGPPDGSQRVDYYLGQHLGDAAD